jgi:hypothetical protein
MLAFYIKVPLKLINQATYTRTFHAIRKDENEYFSSCFQGLRNIASPTLKILVQPQCVAFPHEQKLSLVERRHRAVVHLLGACTMGGVTCFTLCTALLQFHAIFGHLFHPAIPSARSFCLFVCP